jgi:hypothetical protein
MKTMIRHLGKKSTPFEKVLYAVWKRLFLTQKPCEALIAKALQRFRVIFSVFKDFSLSMEGGKPLNHSIFAQFF